MTKSTMGTKLPRKLEQKMQVVGEQIRLASADSGYMYLSQSALCASIR